MAAAKGNQYRAKDRVWSDAISRVLDHRSKSRIDKKLEIDELAEKLVDLAKAGDLAAMKEVGDRLDGKAAQAIEHSGEVAIRDAQELSREELLRIAAEGSPGSSDEGRSEPEPAAVH